MSCFVQNIEKTFQCDMAKQIKEKTNLISKRHKGTFPPRYMESIVKKQCILFAEKCPYFKHAFFTVVTKNENLWTHWVTMKVHKINSILNYVLGCSRVYNPLRITNDNWCLGAHILSRSKCERRYLNQLRTIPSAESLISTVISVTRVICLFSFPLAFFSPLYNTNLRSETLWENESGRTWC